jgi:pimeloyl-ACP methyl ester carboxylesterase
MQTQAKPGQARKIQITGVDIDIWEAGAGRQLLLLHPGDGFDAQAPYVQALAARFHVIAPSSPGFGRSGDPPAHMKSVDDLSYFYLDLMDRLDLRDLLVIGLSFGGWLAAEIAVKNTARMAGLCLVDTVGAKFSDPMTRDIADLFSVPLYQHPQLVYHQEKWRSKSYQNLSDDEATMLARNHQTFGLFGWAPTLHSRHLRHRLHRIDIPTQIIWGAQDRVVSLDYAHQWQQAIPDARMTVIDNAGHYPQIEQPEEFVRTVEQFASSGSLT